MFTLVYFWSRNDRKRAEAWAAEQPPSVGLRNGQRWQGEVESCDRVRLFGPMFHVEAAYTAAGIPVEAEDVLPDWVPPWAPPEVGSAEAATDSEPDSEPVGTNAETIVADLSLVSFASSPAEFAARAAGLSASDFDGRAPSGKSGFTASDVRELIASKAG